MTDNTAMAKPIANLRLFVAAYPPRETAEAMLEALRTLTLPDYRITPIEQVHLTLQFIGDTPARDLDETIESVRRAAGGLQAFDLVPQRLMTLPERGPSRLVAAETDAPATLLELQHRLAMRLARQPRQRKDQRFRPHLTLCRFRSPQQRVYVDVPLSLPAYRVHRIAVMRSTLSSMGAVHHEVACVDLL